jgi:cyclin A
MALLEIEYAPDPDYFTTRQRQKCLSPRSRAVLLDWMFEVSNEYGLKRDSMHAAINYVDRFLSINPTDKEDLQLVGVTALWMGSKMEELCPSTVVEFSKVTAEGKLS